MKIKLLKSEKTEDFDGNDYTLSLERGGLRIYATATRLIGGEPTINHVSYDEGADAPAMTPEIKEEITDYILSLFH